MEEVVLTKELQDSFSAVFGGYIPRRRRRTTGDSGSFTRVEFRCRSKRNRIVTARYDNLTSFVVVDYRDMKEDSQPKEEFLLDMDALLSFDDDLQSSCYTDLSRRSSGFEDISSTASNFSDTTFGSDHNTFLHEVYFLSEEKV